MVLTSEDPSKRAMVKVVAIQRQYTVYLNQSMLINDRTGEISQAVGSQQAKAGEWVHDPRIKFLDGVD
jgi:hypothetical protein